MLMLPTGKPVYNLNDVEKLFKDSCVLVKCSYEAVEESIVIKLFGEAAAEAAVMESRRNGCKLPCCDVIYGRNNNHVRVFYEYGFRVAASYYNESALSEKSAEVV